MGHSTNDSSATVLLEGSTVTHTCDTGFWYPDKVRDKTATCESDGAWSLTAWDPTWDYTCVGESYLSAYVWVAS